ncbi:MAG: hypothetical protein IKJ32_01990 [Clostridia bacterium]|nr:hypothetical protein [Clostridia bacterium]
MTSNTNKNVICVKDIPSNIIEEAIFILKEDIDEDTVDIRKEIARDEAEEFLSEYVIDLENIHRKNIKEKKINLKQILSGVILVIVGMIGILLLK